MQTVLRDGRSNLGDVGMENIVDVAGEHEQSVVSAARAKASTRRSRFLCGLRPPT